MDFALGLGLGTRKAAGGGAPPAPPSWNLTLAQNGTNRGFSGGTAPAYGDITPDVTPDGTVVYAIIATSGGFLRVRAGAAGDAKFNNVNSFTIVVNGTSYLLTWDGANLRYSLTDGAVYAAFGALVGLTVPVTGIPTA